MQYPIFRGLQKPLEFMGIRGRFLIYAAGAIGVVFLSIIITYICFGTGIAFTVGGIVAGCSAIYVFIKQKQGLHSKTRHKGIYVYHYIFKRD